jgi:hypothetical protein
MIKAISYTLLITSVLICSCNANSDNKAEIKDTLNSADVKNTIKEDTKGNSSDSLVYDTDEGFNNIEANKAQAFVLKTFKIDTTKVFLPGVFYNKNDDSYVVQVAVDLKNIEATHSTYYKYFPKTQLVLDGVFYDTLYFNYKFYKH